MKIDAPILFLRSASQSGAQAKTRRRRDCDKIYAFQSHPTGRRHDGWPVKNYFSALAAVSLRMKRRSWCAVYVSAALTCAWQ
ncbi:CoA biosynthesis protein CoaBC [Salmonella enterica subsp. enterica]|nr:CoA biosynthesis protein CoaBC [Salmonella enterica subsp. enterica]